MKVQIRTSDGKIATQEGVERIIFTAESFELVIGGPHLDQRIRHRTPTNRIVQADIRDDEPGQELALEGGKSIVKPGA